MNKATQDAIFTCAHNDDIFKKHPDSFYRLYARRGANVDIMRSVLTGNSDYIEGEFLEFSYDDMGLLIEVSDKQAYADFIADHPTMPEVQLMGYLFDFETLAYGSIDDDFGNLYSADCIYVRESVYLPEDSRFYEVDENSRVYVNERYVYECISEVLAEKGFIYLRSLKAILGEV